MYPRPPARRERPQRERTLMVRPLPPESVYAAAAPGRHGLRASAPYVPWERMPGGSPMPFGRRTQQVGHLWMSKSWCRDVLHNNSGLGN